MTADQRLFSYPLDPQLKRLGWRLDEALAELAVALAKLDSSRASVAALAGKAESVASTLSRSQSQRVDPAQARPALDYLAMLHRRHVVAESDVKLAEKGVDDVRQMLARTQAELDGLERDRADCLAEHLLEVDRRRQREADQDWNARAAWQSRAAAPQETQS